MIFDYKKILPFLPRYFRTYYENAESYASVFRIGAKALFIILTFSYLDKHYIRIGDLNMKTPNMISRIHVSHITIPPFDIPSNQNYDEHEEYQNFEQRLREAQKGNGIKFSLKYHDDPLLEEGRLVDEFLFDNEYMRYRDLSRFQAMKQMQMVGFKDIKNENEINLRRTQFQNFKAKIKPYVE